MSGRIVAAAALLSALLVAAPAQADELPDGSGPDTTLAPPATGGNTQERCGAEQDKSNTITVPSGDRAYVVKVIPHFQACTHGWWVFYEKIVMNRTAGGLGCTNVRSFNVNSTTLGSWNPANVAFDCASGKEHYQRYVGNSAYWIPRGADRCWDFHFKIDISITADLNADAPDRCLP